MTFLVFTTKRVKYWIEIMKENKTGTKMDGTYSQSSSNIHNNRKKWFIHLTIFWKFIWNFFGSFRRNEQMINFSCYLFKILSLLPWEFVAIILSTLNEKKWVWNNLSVMFYYLRSWNILWYWTWKPVIFWPT